MSNRPFTAHTCLGLYVHKSYKPYICTTCVIKPKAF